MTHFGITQLTIPLPFWNDNVHCYMGKQDDGKWVIVDTGLKTEETEQHWLNQFRLLNINPVSDISRILITHHHPDHFGFAHELQKWTNASIFINEKEFDTASHSLTEVEQETFYAEKGMPVDLIKEFNNVNTNKTNHLKHIEFIKENDDFQIGDLNYRAITMPGHSISHTCFYNEDEKVLITGDHLTRDVMPYISHQGIGEVNPLNTYINTLNEMHKLDIKYILPGHGPVFTDVQERIEEVLSYYNDRLIRILNMLGECTAFEVMSKLNPDARTNFDKWVAIGETNALLNYLMALNKVEAVKTGKVVTYCKK